MPKRRFLLALEMLVRYNATVVLFYVCERMHRFRLGLHRRILAPAKPKSGQFHTAYTREVRNSLEVFEMTLTEVSSYGSCNELEYSNIVQNYVVVPAVKCVSVLLIYLIISCLPNNNANCHWSVTVI